MTLFTCIYHESMFSNPSVFRTGFLYLFTISTQGKMANLFLYLLVILALCHRWPHQLAMALYREFSAAERAHLAVRDTVFCFLSGC